AIAAHYLFGEAVTAQRWLGIGFIIVGVYLVARSWWPRPPTCRTRRVEPPRSKLASPLLDAETIAAVGEVLRSGHITSGVWVERFEAALSAFCGGRPVRVVTSAKAAVEAALHLLGH